MKIAAIVGVKDEVELLPRAIAHLFAIGVDRVIARDNASTDGSAEYLRAHVGDRLVLAPLSDEEAGNNEAWARGEAQIARESGADWVVFLDADEFWLPASGALRGCAQLADPSIDVLTVPRHNVPLVDGEPMIPAHLDPELYGEVLLVARPPAADFKSYLEEHPAAAWITGVPVPKIAVRCDRVGPLHLGHHDVDGAGGMVLKREIARDLVIAHLPFTTASRFERKVRNIRDLLRDHEGIFPGHAAWHWKRWAAMEGEHALAEEFGRQSLDGAALRDMRTAGTIQSAAQLLGMAGR